jgi:hypothetical protein
VAVACALLIFANTASGSALLGDPPFFITVIIWFAGIVYVLKANSGKEASANAQ